MEHQKLVVHSNAMLDFIKQALHHVTSAVLEAQAQRTSRTVQCALHVCMLPSLAQRVPLAFTPAFQAPHVL